MRKLNAYLMFASGFQLQLHMDHVLIAVKDIQGHYGLFGSGVRLLTDFHTMTGVVFSKIVDQLD